MSDEAAQWMDRWQIQIRSKQPGAHAQMVERHHDIFRRLLLKVEHVMHAGDRLPLINRGTSLREALLEMTQKGLGMTAVVEADGRLAGIFTDGDLRRTLDKGIDVRQASIDQVMTLHGKTADADMLAAEALKIMEDNKINALVVVDETTKNGLIFPGWPS